MRHAIAAAFAALLAWPAGAGAPAEPVSERLTYRTYLGGLPLGTLTLDLAMDRAGYAGEARFDVTALIRTVLDSDATVRVEGGWRGDEAAPRRFDYDLRDGKKRRRTVMAFDEAGSVASVDADPPFKRRRHSIGPEDVPGAVDPATAAILLAAPRAAPCALDMRVFDGKQLHGVTLSEGREAADGTVTCEGRYERLAGFKPKRMREAIFPFEAEMDPAGEGRWRPRIVRAPTKFGTATAVLRR